MRIDLRTQIIHLSFELLYSDLVQLLSLLITLIETKEQKSYYAIAADINKIVKANLLTDSSRPSTSEISVSILTHANT